MALSSCLLILLMFTRDPFSGSYSHDIREGGRGRLV